MTCCGTSPLQKKAYESPALRTLGIGYDMPSSLATTRYASNAAAGGNALGNIADLVSSRYLASPPRQERGIPAKVLYGVPGSKIGSGSYSNEAFPRINYMPMDAGYAHMPSLGTGGGGG